MIAAVHLSLGQVAASLVLVGVAALVSIRQRADSFIQVVSIGYVIKVIFQLNNLAFVVALLAAMVLFGAITARRRARRVPHAF